MRPSAGYRHTGIFLFLLIGASVFAAAQSAQFKPFASFRVIQTEYFDIIFPRESEPTARLLASYADRVYRQVSSLLGIEIPRRIPVSITPHTDMFNGFYHPSFYYIMLFDTPMDIEWTAFANSLESLFLHELTHAVSMNTRSASLKAAHRIFGSYVAPALANAPLFMAEGATVSFESLGGFGRANDPLVKQSIRQAVYEDKILSPFQASGLYDLPVQGGGPFYEYGGLFSAWLQRAYGMDKYAELWQAMGRDIYFSFFVYRSGFYRIFSRVYNIDFLDAWKMFCDSFALADIEENSGELLPRKYRFLSEKRNFIDFMAAGGENIYFIEERKIRSFNTRTGKTRTLATDTMIPCDIDVDGGNGKMLVSGYRIMGDRYRAVVTEHRAKTGWKTGRAIEGLFRARYFRDGVVGLRSELHNTCIVYEDFKGAREIFFRGNEGLVFSGPQVIDNERIAFIAARGGIRELWLYHYTSGDLFRVEMSPEGGDVPAGDVPERDAADADEGEGADADEAAAYWPYMRGLSASGGRLFFSHNADDRMYKLAALDLGACKAVFSQRDFSGGVFNPVAIGGDVYYRGAFSTRDGFLRFPEAADSLSGKRGNLILEKLDRQSYEKAGPAGPAELLERDDLAPEPPYEGGPSRPHFAIRYMNPFHFWFPLLLVRAHPAGEAAFPITLDGGGLFSLISEPTGRNLVQIFAYADGAYLMAMVGNFTWQNTALGFPLELAFLDQVADSDGSRYRETRASLIGSYNWSMGQWSAGIAAGGLFARIANQGDERSAYKWEESGHAFAVSGGLAFSNLRKRQYEMFGTGLSLDLSAISITENFKPRVLGLLHASAESRFPVGLALFGGYDALGMDVHGKSRSYGDPLFLDFASAEYTSGGASLDWLAGGEAALGLFSWEIQKHLSHLYFNRLFGSLAVRSSVYDGKGSAAAEGFAIGDIRLAQSLVLKLNLVFSLLPLKTSPFFFEPYIWGAWKYSNTFNGKGDHVYFDVGFKAVM